MPHHITSAQPHSAATTMVDVFWRSSASATMAATAGALTAPIVRADRLKRPGAVDSILLG